MNRPPLNDPYSPLDPQKPLPSEPVQTPPGQQSVAVQVPHVRPVVTYTIIVVTVIFFLLQLASTAFLNGDYLAAFGAKINQYIIAGQYWRLITPVLLHSTAFPYLHILFNMYALYNIGRSLEEEYGHGRYLALYLLGGFAGNVASFLMSTGSSYGASTAIFGLLGAEGVLVYQNRRFLGKNFRPVLINIISIAAINLVLGLNPGIDNWGHLGGLIGGTLFAWFAGPLWDVEGLFPNLRLVDRRSQAAVLSAGVAVAVLTAAIAFLTIVNRAL
jgi:rhomboid protease GluP